MVIFHSYVKVYQRVSIVEAVQNHDSNLLTNKMEATLKKVRFGEGLKTGRLIRWMRKWSGFNVLLWIIDMRQGVVCVGPRMP